MQSSFGGLLAVAFIILKLMGYIAWAWVWVLAPIWIPVALILLIGAFALTGIALFSKPRPARRW